ncbi:GAF domain-containing protein [Thermodesulfobacteriota bacterium]
MVREQGYVDYNYKKDGEQSIPVGAEIAPIFIYGEHRGGYAGLVDLSLSEKINMEIFDHSPFGIVKVDTFEQFTYANHMALEIMGLPTWKSKYIRDIFPDDENYGILKKQLEKRKKGFSDEYEADITRISDDQKVPVKISAIPETDLRGNVVGSLAIVRSLLLDKTVEGIHKHIATIHDGQEILEAVAKETQKVIPNALFSVSAYTRGMTHVNQMFSHYSEGHMEWQVRWWEIPDYLAPWLEQKEIIVVESVDALLNQDGWQELLENPTVKIFLKEGFKSSIRYPVIAKDRVIASVALYGKNENDFNQTHIDIMNKLPLHKAVLMAFYYNEVSDLRFRLDLINEISTATNSIQDVADIIVNRLAEHYQWEHIALFRVDEERREFRPMSEKSSSEVFRLSGDFKQSLDEGVLGYVYRKNEPVKIGNVNTDIKFKDIHKKSLRNSVSELCLPIKTGEVFWILNIEDSRQNAFSDEEQRTLMDLMREVGDFLEKCWLYHFREASFLSATDAIIVTDIKGNIKRVNPATTKLLGDSEEEMRDKCFKDYFKDSDFAQHLLKTDMIVGDEAILRNKKGNDINVILSISQTQKDFSRKVFFATDLSLQKYLEKLKYINKMYHEIATQTKPPLSMIFSWLKKLKRESESDSNIEILDKAIRQLRKVELTYDRLALYEKEKGDIPYTELLLSISEVLNNVIDELPKTDIKKIDIEYVHELPYLLGDIFQLSFSFMSILSYLLRFVPDDEKIRVKIMLEKETVVTRIDGFIPELSKEETKVQSLIAKTLAEMSLGENIIKAFVNNHGGKFHNPVRKGNQINFQVDLPTAKGY